MKNLLLPQFTDIGVIHLHLDKAQLNEQEKEAILEVIDHIFQHKLLILVLDHLEPEQKTHFVTLLDSDNHLAVVDYMKTNVIHIEDKINLLVEEVHRSVIEDIAAALEE